MQIPSSASSVQCCMVSMPDHLLTSSCLQIRPFLFSWPTGTFHNYITAIKRGAESDQSQVDFVGASWASLTGACC